MPSTQHAQVPLQPPERHFRKPFKHQVGWFPFGFACHSPWMMKMVQEGSRAAYWVCLTLASNFKACRAEANPLSIFFLLDLISSWWLTSESIRVLNYHCSPLNLADAGLCMEHRNYTWTGRGKAAAQIEGTAPRAHCIATTVTHWKLIIKIHLNNVSFVVLSKLNKCSFTAW